MDEKNSKLSEILSDMGRVMVAFSGGVDSAFVLKRAQQELGDQVLAVVVGSELFRESEFDQAVALAEEMGVPVLKTAIKELEDERIAANNPDSWYFSKKLLYQQINQLATELGYDYVLDGMIMDDLDDFRPGLRARTEAGVRSILQEVGLWKKEIRALSKQLDLPVWNKPASCSLASRIPYGVKLNERKIEQVDLAEQYIIKLGFETVRVRHHENIARIEVPVEDMSKLLQHHEQIQSIMELLGFTYTSLDLQGYRTGSMNEVLTSEELEKEIG